MPNLFKVMYDAPSDNGGGSGEPSSNPAPAANPAPTAQPGLITQDKMNSLLAEQKRTAKAKTQELTEKLKAEQEKSTTSEAEKQALQARIDELNQIHETSEETAKRKQAEMTERLNKTTEDLTKDRDGWKKRFLDAEIGREIISAAEESGAFNTQQISDLISHKVNAEIAEDGTLKLMIGEGDDAKSIKDHIVAMKENVEQYGNLFRTDKVSGQGSQNANAGAVNPEFANMSVDQIIAARAKKRESGVI